MSKNLIKCFEKLELISKIKNSETRKKVIGELFDDCLYKALNEISINTVSGKVPLNKKQKSLLRKHKLVIKKLSCNIKNKSKRKKLVVQSGGIWPVLIPAVASVITTLLAK
jgi:hypothetical protein